MKHGRGLTVNLALSPEPFVNNYRAAYYAHMAEDAELRHLRERIDDADRELIDALSERMKIIEQIGTYKKKHGLHVYDAARQKEVLSKCIERGRSRGLTGNLVRAIFESILKYSKELQK
jgi:chorismate mutase